MAFKPKHKKYGGARKGSKHKKTKQWELVADYLLDEGTGRFMNILKNCDDDEFTKYFLTILEYFKPKFSRIDTAAKTGQNFHTRFGDYEPLEKIEIVYVDECNRNIIQSLN